MYRIIVAYKTNPDIVHPIGEIADYDFMIELVGWLIRTRLYSRIIILEVNNA
jgi:hypothetical protein